MPIGARIRECRTVRLLGKSSVHITMLGAALAVSCTPGGLIASGATAGPPASILPADGRVPGVAVAAGSEYPAVAGDGGGEMSGPATDADWRAAVQRVRLLLAEGGVDDVVEAVAILESLYRLAVNTERSVPVDLANALLEPHFEKDSEALPQDAAERLWVLHRESEVHQHRLLTSLVANLIVKHADVFASHGAGLLSGDSARSVRFGLRILRNATSPLPPVRWPSMLERWRTDRDCYVELLELLAARADVDELPAVERAIESDANPSVRERLTVALGGRWLRSGDLGERVRAARKACDAGRRDAQDIWLLAHFGEAKDLAVMARMLFADREFPANGRIVGLADIELALFRMNERFFGANPAGEAEGWARLLSLAPPEQGALVLALPPEWAIADKVWALAHSAGASLLVRQCAFCSYANGIAKLSPGLDRLAELRNIQGGSEELHRRFNACIEHVGRLGPVLPAVALVLDRARRLYVRNFPDRIPPLVLPEERDPVPDAEGEIF